MPIVIYLILVLISLSIVYVHSEIEFFQNVLDYKIVEDDKQINCLKKQTSVNEGAIKLLKARIEANENNIQELIRCEKEREDADKSV